MTVTSAISTIADSIAGIVISGVTIKDIDQIPDAAAMLCPLMIPSPANFVSDYNMTFETFGSMGAAKMNSVYTLNYIYLHCELGSGVNSFAPYADVMSKVQTILVAIFSNDKVTGLVDLSLQSISPVGVITDPAGNECGGVQIALRVLEHNQ